LQVWPTVGPVNWPPERAFDRVGWDALVMRFKDPTLGGLVG
jgi:hypothetical protein